MKICIKNVTLKKKPSKNMSELLNRGMLIASNNHFSNCEESICNLDHILFQYEDSDQLEHSEEI